MLYDQLYNAAAGPLAAARVGSGEWGRAHFTFGVQAITSGLATERKKFNLPTSRNIGTAVKDAQYALQIDQINHKVGIVVQTRAIEP